MNFKTIETMAQFKTARNDLQKRGGQFSKDFADFCVASVKFFYNAGNKNIQIINDLVVIAEQTRGLNAAKLCDWLACTIPHELVAEAFKRQQHARMISITQYRFGKKKEGQDYDECFAFLFVNNNPKWHLYGKPVESEAFNAQADAVAVLKFLKSHAKKARDNNEVLYAATIESAMAAMQA